jgi:hypothetical protein
MRSLSSLMKTETTLQGLIFSVEASQTYQPKLNLTLI